MKKLMTILILSLTMILLGCSGTDELQNMEEIRAKVESLLEERYGEYFDNKSFGCGDYLIDGDASMEYHDSQARREIREMIELAVPDSEHSIMIKCEDREDIIESYEEFCDL